MESTVTLNMLASVYLEELSKLPSLLFSTSDPTRGLSSSVLSLPGMEMCRHWCCFCGIPVLKSLLRPNNSSRHGQSVCRRVQAELIRQGFCQDECFVPFAEVELLLWLPLVPHGYRLGADTTMDISHITAVKD